MESSDPSGLTPLEYFLFWEKERPHQTFLRQPIEGHWHSYTFTEAAIEARKIASYFAKLGLPPHTRIAILSKNCAHWIMADLAIMMAGHVSVPIYPTLSSAGIRHILDHSEASLIFIGKLDHFESQRDGIPPQLHKIYFNQYGLNEGKSWDEIVSVEASLEDLALPPAEAMATIMYSSGTTGTPKGVVLTHRAFGWVGKNVALHFNINSRQRFFSYLPLSHIAERGLVEMVALYTGSSISFAESLENFLENIQHERPTIFGGVPRIWSKFREGVLAKLPQRKLNLLLRLPLVSPLIKRTIRKKLGLSEANVLVTGAAPTPLELMNWYTSVGMEIREVYGMTENTAYSHANYGKIKSGTVGQPWPDVKIKLSNESEILVKHDALMKEYYKDTATTTSVFTGDGFLRTGDTGVIDSDGFLTLTGRLKDQFKTDKGKFISPAPIELKLLANKDIDQVCVVGMGIPQPIALVVLAESAQRKNREQIVASLTETLGHVNHSLETFEVLQCAVIMKEGWTIENRLLTPSLKVKRSEVEQIHLKKYPSWFAEGSVVVWEK